MRRGLYGIAEDRGVKKEDKSSPRAKACNAWRYKNAQ